MKSLSLAFCIFLIAGSGQARPQYGPPPPVQPQRAPSPQQSGSRAPAPGAANGGQQNLPDGCRIVYKNVQTIVEIESEDIVCTPFEERVCDTKYRQACNPYQLEECRTVYEEVCETKYDNLCNDLFRDVPEQYEEDDCRDELTRACDSHWVVEAGGDKVWEEDPSTCRQIPETKCSKVKKTRTRKESYTVCKVVPREECRNVPEEQCRQVTKEKCERQAYQDCKYVTNQRCETVHRKTPQSRTERKPITVCDDKINDVIDVVPFLGGNVGGTEFTNSDDAVIIASKSDDPRDGGEDIERNPDDDAEVFVFSN